MATTQGWVTRRSTEIAKNSLTRMLQDSTTNKVLEQTSVPVEVIAGDAVSKLERYGLPTGLVAALALLIAAVD